MDIVQHRKNSIEALTSTPSNYGVEVDVRTLNDRLIIHHDPFAPGEDFENWLSHYNHGLLILNVKEEGLEARLLKLMESSGISDFFFLDQSFPFMLKTAKTGENRCAVRVSQYESAQTALNLSGLVKWVWLDLFEDFRLEMPCLREELEELTSFFNVCLVSPELQGRLDRSEVEFIRGFLHDSNIELSSVCTKLPELWQ
jgi:hypothetical protein